MKPVSMTRRFAGLFLVLSVSLSLLIGAEAWREWQAYRATEVEYQHFELSEALIELIEGLQYERLLAVRYANSLSETTQTSVLAKLRSRQQDNDARFDIVTAMPEFIALSPLVREQIKVTWLERKPFVHKLDMQLAQEVEVFSQHSTHSIDRLINLLRQKFLFHQGYASATFDTLYHSVAFSESLGQLRSLGTKILLTSELTRAELVTWAQLSDRLLFFFDRFPTRDTLQTKSCWQALMSVNQQLLDMPDLLEDVQAVFVSLNDWSELMDENHRYIQQALTEQIKANRDVLMRKTQSQLFFFVLILLVWITLVAWLWWIYQRWVLKGFVGSFKQLQQELGQMVKKVNSDLFEPIQLPDTCLSQEIMEVVVSANELLTEIEFEHYVLTEQSHQLVEMVQAVIEVMTEVNHGRWEVRLALPAEGQLAQLRDTINTSIEYIKLSQQATLHQERLTVMGNMATSFAHEINNPIAGILMNVEYLKTLPQADSEATEIIEETLTALLRVRKLILSMLALGQQDKPKKSAESVQASCSFKEIMGSVMRMSHALAKHAGVVFDFDSQRLQEVTCALPVSADKLELILFSLISHAVHSLSDAPTALDSPLQLSVDYFRLEASHQVLVRITDSVPSAQDSFVAQMMDPFFVNKTGSSETIGLQRIVQLVRELNGVLTVDEGYSFGTRFLLYLPIMVSESEEPEQPLISETRRKELTKAFGDDAYEAIFARYVAELPQALEEIQFAFDRHTMPEARHLAHSLKGSSLGLGVDVIANACAELEVLAMKEASNPQPEIVAMIFARLNQLTLALQAQTETINQLAINTPPPLRRS